MKTFLKKIGGFSLGPILSALLGLILVPVITRFISPEEYAALLKDADTLQRWNIIMAGNLLLVLPMLVLYIFASKKIRNAFVYSGIK